MKIKIRTMTFGVDKSSLVSDELSEIIDRFFKISDYEFKEAQLKLNTKRINLPLLNQNEEINFERLNKLIENLDTICKRTGIRWFNVPFSSFGDSDSRKIHDFIIDIIKHYQSAFTNLHIAKNKKINFKGISNAAKIISSISKLSSNGYDNFRFGVSSNIRPNTPFFPFTFQEGENCFSVGLEFVDVFIKITEDNLKLNLEDISQILIEKISPVLKKINDVCIKVEDKSKIKYAGMDISLAPLPNERNSVAKLIELLGSENFGSHGTLFLTSFLTNILKKIIANSKIRECGFNGVMFSQLEDKGMSKSNNTKLYNIDSLILYSSVCGCGVDMVPIPGDSLEEDIYALISDVAGLSCTWNKPLGVRLLPIPMKYENQLTDFNHDFLFNSRIQSIGINGLNRNFHKNLNYNYE